MADDSHAILKSIVTGFLALIVIGVIVLSVYVFIKMLRTSKADDKYDEILPHVNQILSKQISTFGKMENDANRDLQIKLSSEFSQDTTEQSINYIFNKYKKIFILFYTEHQFRQLYDAYMKGYITGNFSRIIDKQPVRIDMFRLEQKLIRECIKMEIPKKIAINIFYHMKPDLIRMSEDRRQNLFKMIAADTVVINSSYIRNFYKLKNHCRDQIAICANLFTSMFASTVFFLFDEYIDQSFRLIICDRMCEGDIARMVKSISMKMQIEFTIELRRHLTDQLVELLDEKLGEIQSVPDVVSSI